MDLLCYWVIEMYVDGFCFDFVSMLVCGLYEVDQFLGFFIIIYQDFIIFQVKLIVELWDVGEGGYQVGNFLVNWVEWNGIYCDDMCLFWKGEGGLVFEIGYCIIGSFDFYEFNGCKLYVFINFVIVYDGFILCDLVIYE